ncbi:MAG TPA: response regulator transcription factor [Actinomycetota bacterium]|nr:response regulator transcription factor [Actinomycetota bacterium]
MKDHAQGRVLVVDDEPIVRDVLGRYLEREGFAVETAADGEEALDAAGRFRPDLVLLDLMLPKIDGLEVFRRLGDAGSGSTAVIMLTARGEEVDRVVGLELGADDYVVKPFSPREVVARVRAVLRRSSHERPAREAPHAPIVAGELVIDGAAREVRRAGRLVRLTPKELDVLLLLARTPRRVFSRIDILDELWDFAFDGDPSTVTVHVRRLREKLERDPSAPVHLVTVWGAGYRFDP